MRRLAALTGEGRNRLVGGGMVDQFQHIAMPCRRGETRERDQKDSKGENQAFHIPNGSIRGKTEEILHSACQEIPLIPLHLPVRTAPSAGSR